MATDGIVEEVLGGEVPSSGPMRGIVYLRNKVLSSQLAASPELNRVCAFGDGLFCFDGSAWQTEIPSGTGPPLNAVAVLDEGDDAHIVAVGDDGRVVVKGEDAWQSPDLGVGVDFHAVSAHFERFTAAGGKGALVDGEASAQIVCDGYDEPFLSVSWSVDLFDEGGTYFVALARSGEFIHGSLGEGHGALCDSGVGVPEPPVIGRMIGAAYYVISDSTLFMSDYGSSPIIE